VIDYFLGQNPTLQDVGKLLVAWVLLEAEARSRLGLGNHNRREMLEHSPDMGERQRAARIDPTVYQDNWYRFVIHKLVTGCIDGESLLANKVTFVTFNYDVSLEYRLYKGLTAISQFGDDEAIMKRFFSDGRFLHIYGRLREIPYNDPPPIDPDFVPGQPTSSDRGPLHWAKCKELFDRCYEVSKQIRTIAPFEKVEDENVKAARRATNAASCVYILGYGFDENNSKLLGLHESLRLDTVHGKTVPFTNYGDSNLVNKKASRLFFGRPAVNEARDDGQ
jgi:hypothetical protein